MGFRIEMDDFGTGYSSLSYLNNFPADLLKIDKAFIDQMNMSESSKQYVAMIMSFVHNAFGEHRDVRMIELVIDIAEYLNVPIVAEGVETEEQCLALKELGCDIVQGYYFSKPIPCGEFEKFFN